MQNLALSRSHYFRSSEGKPAKKVLEDHSRNSQEILIPASEVRIKGRSLFVFIRTLHCKKDPLKELKGDHCLCL